MSQPVTVDALRQQYIDFFASRDHRVLPSASLIPDSPSTLLTGAGMQPFVPAFRGEAVAPARNVVTAQKCCRSGDIDEVGRTARHHTFFEMMGNFSFGGYFKKGAIELAWELVTDVWGIDKDSLWATVYTDDDESAELWRRLTSIPAERIVRCGKEDNWWPQTVWDGPCGPCTEIYVDQGPSIWCDDPDKGPASKGDRFLEIWNLVFQMYNQSLDGSLANLPAPGVDTGLGLERLAAVLQGVPSNFDTDIFRPLLDAIAGLSAARGNKSTYGSDGRTTVNFRAIADHARSITFMIGDGILPSNEGRGYVLRRILRRAFRFARVLGLRTPFLHELVPVVGQAMGVGYPELPGKVPTIAKVVRAEEERFCSTLEQGLGRLEDLIASVKGAGGTELPGLEVFRLYDTFGFHRELTLEYASEAGLSIDQEGYQRALEAQRSRSVFQHTESAAKKAFYVTLARELPASEFLRDATGAVEATVVAVLGDDEKLAQAEEGDECALLLDRTPFYAEKGGQSPDHGRVVTETGVFTVLSTQEPVDGIILHIGRVLSGQITPAQAASAELADARRQAIRRAHSATHLLHAALRTHVGDHVAQAGSLVDEDRLRFDFSHYEALTPAQIQAVEETVQAAVLAGLPIVTDTMSIEDAQQTGAVALFGEKYSDVVRVVSMGDASKELCGGTHLDNTGLVGPFVILSEGSVAAGTRRIEALTGMLAPRHAQEQRQLLHSAAEALGSSPTELVSRIDSLQAEAKAQRKQIQDLKRRGATGPSPESLLGEAHDVGKGVRLVAAQLDGLDPESLSGLADRIVEQDASAVALLAAPSEGKIPIVCKVGAEALAAGAHAGNLAGALAKACGGGGGGAPAFARAGGKDASGLEAGLAQARELLTQAVAKD